MRRLTVLVAVGSALLLVCCKHPKEEPVAMPQSDLSQVVGKWPTYYKNRFQLANRDAGQTVSVEFYNPTKFEIASISGDVIAADQAGNELSRTPFVFDSFVTNTLLYKGSLMPMSLGRATGNVKYETPARAFFEIKSATYFAKGDDLSDRNHLMA